MSDAPAETEKEGVTFPFPAITEKRAATARTVYLAPLKDVARREIPFGNVARETILALPDRMSRAEFRMKAEVLASVLFAAERANVPAMQIANGLQHATTELDAARRVALGLEREPKEPTA